MVNQPADRLSSLPPYIFSEISQRIKTLNAQGHEIIRLDMGVPDGPPPPAVIEALVELARNPAHHTYMPYSGTPPFRRAVARYYEQRFGIRLDPDTQVLPLLGSKEGLAHLCLAYLNPGDLVLVPSLAYPSYERGSIMAGAEIYRVRLDPAQGFLPDLTAIPAEIADRAKLLFVNYPNNPTGAIASKDDYRRISEFCAQHEIQLISDNPYVELTFDGCQAGSALEVDPTCVEFMSFSKAFNMSGWRLGAAVGNRDMLKMLLTMKSNIDSAHFRAVYDAGIAALEQTSPEWAVERNAIYQRRRDKVMEALPVIGLQAAVPQGAMYVWARALDGDGLRYTTSALDKARVSLTPGLGFGPDGQEYVRFSLGIADDQLMAALDRLADWYRSQ